VAQTRLSGHSKRLTLIGFGLILAILLANGLAIGELRRQAGDEVRARTNNRGLLIAEQTANSLQAVDLVLGDIQRHLPDFGVTTPGRFDQVLGTRDFHDTLARRLAMLPQADVILVLDANGTMINTSSSWPISDDARFKDLSARDYFVYFKTHDDHAAYVSAPVVNRLTGQPTIFMARRVNGPGGEFLGVLLGAMRLKYFDDIYAGLGLPQGSGITLLRRDGTLLVRFPPAPAAVPRMPAESAWYRLVRAGGGNYRSPGYFGDGALFVSVHPLATYPVVVDTTVSDAAAFALWRRQASMIAVGTACAVLLFLILMYALIAQFRRLEQEREAAIEHNEELERTRTRLESQAEKLLRTTAAMQESKSSLKEKSNLLETTLEHMDQGLIMVNGDGFVDICNRTAMAMLDLPPELMRTHPPLAEVVAHQRRTAEFAALGLDITAAMEANCLRADHEAPHSYERRATNGRLLEVRGQPIAGGGFVRTYTDITERKAAEDRVHYLAHHDELTRLANRVSFRERLEQELKLRRRDDNWSVLYLDLDHFKNVNDTLGHPVGDKLLSAVAERLRGCVREGDIVARLGGDEFAIAQTGVEQPRQATALAGRLIEALGRPFDIGEHHVTVGTSVGIAIGPADGISADTLLQNADMALYRAKADGRGGFRFFEPIMDAQVQARRRLEMDLREALANGEFELFYQPMLNTGTGVLSGFEALIRWRHPLRGLMKPGEFIPLAEEIGLIVPIGEWVLREACREAATWAGDMKVAVNLSPAQFHSSNLVNAVRSALEASGLRPDRLELEIVESMLLQNTTAMLDILHQLRALGLSIAMDDFGTGYSSLGYLRSFPFDSIKIDQSFIRDLNTNPDSRAIVHTIMELSRTLGMSVTAEGVETNEQLAIVRGEGCSEVQGYLFSAPCPGAEVAALIARFATEVMQAA
jgi:diguanylate cyclase (GGDEF)-like protein